MRGRSHWRGFGLALVAAAWAIIPASAQAGWSKPQSLPVERVETVEATMSPQGHATVGGAQGAGPTDFFSRGPRPGAVFSRVGGVGPCLDTSSCPFDLDAGPGTVLGAVSDQKREASSGPGAESSVVSLLRSSAGAVTTETLDGPDPGLNFYNSRVDLNDLGAGVAAWSSGGVVQAATKPRRGAGGFGEPVTVSPFGAAPPAVAIGDDATAVIVYELPGDGLYVTRRLPGAGGWSTPAPIAETDTQAAAVAVGDSGKAWTAFVAGGSLFLHPWSPGDSTPQDNSLVSCDSPSGVDGKLELELDAKGRPAVAYRAGSQELTLASVSAGECTERRAAPSDAGDFSFAVGGARALLAWTRAADSGSGQVLEARTGALATLQRTSVKRLAGGLPDLPSAAIAASGDAVVAFRRSTDEGDSRLVQASYRRPR